MENSVKRNKSIMEKVATGVTRKINKHLNKEGIELKKMQLGMEVLLINISKFIIIFSLAYILGLLKEAIFMSLIFGSLRKNAFGLHAENSIVCTSTTSLIFLGGPYISSYMQINNYMVVIIFAILNLLIYIYSPADTEKHPILGKKLRAKLKKKAVITGIILMIITLMCTSYIIKSMIIIAVTAEVITILPITYKILNRGYKNYEKFQRNTI